MHEKITQQIHTPLTVIQKHAKLVVTSSVISNSLPRLQLSISIIIMNEHSIKHAKIHRKLPKFNKTLSKCTEIMHCLILDVNILCSQMGILSLLHEEALASEIEYQDTHLVTMLELRIWTYYLEIKVLVFILDFLLQAVHKVENLGVHFLGIHYMEL
ncbi:hypothetical protein ACJX0J_023733 [Zea mays]